MKKFFLPLLFSVFFLTCLVWAIIIPFNEAPDEYTHFDVARFISFNNRFPIFGKDENMGVSKYDIPGVVLKYNASYSTMPPLAYLWQAAFLKVIKFSRENLYLSARIANASLGLIFLLLTYLLSKILFKESYQQIIFTIISTFIPQVIFTFSYVNSDGILLVFSILLWLWLVKFLKSTRINFKESFLFGAVIGLSVLTRYNIATLLIITVIIFIRQVIILEKDFLRRIENIVLAGSTSLFIGGGWYVRNFLVYGDILATKKFWETYHMIFPPQDLGKSFYTPIYVMVKTDWFWRTWQSLWASFSWNNLLLPDSIYRILLAIFILSIVFLYFSWKRLVTVDKQLSILSLFTFILTIIFSIWQSLKYAFQPQGRYLFPALPAIIYLLLLPWYKVLGGEREKTQIWPQATGIIFASFTIWLSIYSLIGIIIPAYF